MQDEYVKDAIELSLQCSAFEQKMTILYGCIIVEVLKVLYHFLSFFTTFSQEKAHNMFALLFDSRFKKDAYCH